MTLHDQPSSRRTFLRQSSCLAASSLLARPRFRACTLLRDNTIQLAWSAVEVGGRERRVTR